MQLSDRQQKILIYVKQAQPCSSSMITTGIVGQYTERTIQRDIQDLIKIGILVATGAGRAIVYNLAVTGQLFVPYEPISYTTLPPEQRLGASVLYQPELLSQWSTRLFTPETYDTFLTQTTNYTNRITKQSTDIRKKELERFVIELSWKSSKIEGNTYTLLDTERLLLEGIASSSNTPEETTMILNHKVAFAFVQEYAHTTDVTLSVAFIEQVHRLLLDGLLTDIGLRKQAVGITGSTYRPLDNQFQIKEAFDTLVTTINHQATVYDQALTALLGISYLQPFVDGNKRTARLVANGILLAGGAAPLSYRNVDEVLYRASLLVFYEQGSVIPMRDLFIEQYIFAAEHYS